MSKSRRPVFFLATTVIHGEAIGVMPLRSQRMLLGPRCLSRTVRELRDERKVGVGAISVSGAGRERTLTIASETPGIWHVSVSAIAS